MHVEVLATALVFAAVEHAEADPEAAADPHVGLGHEDGWTGALDKLEAYVRTLAQTAEAGAAQETSP